MCRLRWKEVWAGTGQFAGTIPAGWGGRGRNTAAGEAIGHAITISTSSDEGDLKSIPPHLPAEKELRLKTRL